MINKGDGEMSDWSESIQRYEEQNYEGLAEEFIAKYDTLWYEFVSEKFFSTGGEMNFYNV